MNPELLREIAPQSAWRLHAMLGEDLLLWRKAQPQEMNCVNPCFIRNQHDELTYPRPRNQGLERAINCEAKMTSGRRFRIARNLWSVVQAAGVRNHNPNRRYTMSYTDCNTR